MAYSTAAMVRRALAPQSGDGNSVPSPLSLTAADMTNPQLEDAIAEADALIDGYLSKFYTVPVAAVGEPTAAIPHPIDYWSRSVAAYLATCTYRGSLDFTDNDPVYRRYRDVMDLLKGVAKGDVSLSIPAKPGADGNAGAGSASAPVNPYSGDLFPVADFDVQGDVWPAGSAGALQPLWHDPYWG